LVGGVILFARNYQNKQQLRDLVSQIRAIRYPELLIAVDQEGGRVQRFKDEFTLLPAAAEFGRLWHQDKQTAPMRAFESAYTMASELAECGVDFSFAPVFDVNSEDNEVIGDRCFDPNPKIAAELLGAYIDGMHSAGMVAIAKHFPGHGGVSGDSHHCLPCDSRSLAEIQQHDVSLYRELINEIDGVMTAHVLFDQCDDQIPTYSQFWIQQQLRGELGFSGIVFSDDLSMKGAGEDGSVTQKGLKALAAGCDMLLICNQPEQADELLQGLTDNSVSVDQQLSFRLHRLRAQAN
jgi:beta-N-acetylhexosaminidase